MARLSAPALVALVAVSLAGSSAGAQGFPAPGTGVFTWEPVTDRPLSIESFSFAPDGRLYAATDTVYVYDPAPEGPPAGRWRRLGYPRLTIDAVLALDPAGDTLFAGRPSRINRSVDGGATWAIVNGDASGTVVGGPNTPDGFYVVPAGHAHAGRILAGGSVLYSDDRGTTWTDVADSFPDSEAFAHVFETLPSGRVLMGGWWGAAASGDGGVSYAVTPVWGAYRYLADGLTSLATPGSRQAGAPACGLADISLCDGAVAVGGAEAGPEVRAWRTNDGGRTWSEPAVLPEPNDGIGYGAVVGVVALAPGPDGLGRAITVLGRGLVYATADGGQTWAAVGRLPTGDVAHFTILLRLGPDGHLWVSTLKAGTVKAPLYRSAEPAEAAFPVAGEAPPVPSSEVGLSVRPNPAGGRVEVVVTLAEAGPVRVVVLDALGREVAVVHDGDAASGERVAGVDTAAWPAGVYVVRATAGAGVASARLVVAR